ncbi:MAG: hypothetical protein ACI92S_002884 [Planctomycetaceae bacterium]|jgi:hypothetical protein
MRGLQSPLDGLPAFSQRYFVINHREDDFVFTTTFRSQYKNEVVIVDVISNVNGVFESNPLLA